MEASGAGGGVRELVRMSLEDVETRVRKVLPAFTDVAGAYLFGSCLGACRPDSDIDLGLVLRGHGDPVYLEARVSGALGLVEGHPFHITVLTAGEFAFQAIHVGRLIYEADAEAVADMIEKVAKEHHANRRYLATFVAAREESLRQWL